LRSELLKRTRTGPVDFRLASPQQKLWLQKSGGSGGRRRTVQSLTTLFQVLPSSVENSIWYFEDEGGLPEEFQLAA
jgi:hypothetical protein